MSVELVLFVIFGITAVVGGLAVVLARNPVYGAMGLMLTLFSLAVFYVVMSAHLVAAVQVIVYAGAVMTLFLFVIMLIGVDRAEDLRESLRWQRILVGVVLAAAVATGAVLVAGDRFRWLLTPATDAPANGTIEAVGQELFERWVLPFEVTSLLLIIASVGAIALAYFGPVRRRPADSPGGRGEPGGPT
jgi:NADH-quinone oxidoreductase subunit J